MMEVKEMAAMGRAARDAKYDEATRIVWAMRGGPKRKKNAEYRPMEALTTARKKFEKLRAQTHKAGIPDSDVFMAVVWSDQKFTELLEISLIRHTISPDGDDLELLGKAWQGRHAIPVGYVGGVFSRQSKDYVTFARPLVVDNPAIEPLLALALDRVQLPTGEGR